MTDSPHQGIEILISNSLHRSDVCGAEHAAIEDLQGQPNRSPGRVRLQQIERQAGTAVTQAVEVPMRGSKPAASRRLAISVPRRT